MTVGEKWSSKSAKMKFSLVGAAIFSGVIIIRQGKGYGILLR